MPFTENFAWAPVAGTVSRYTEKEMDIDSESLQPGAWSEDQITTMLSQLEVGAQFPRLPGLCPAMLNPGIASHRLDHRGITHPLKTTPTNRKQTTY